MASTFTWCWNNSMLCSHSVRTTHCRMPRHFAKETRFHWTINVSSTLKPSLMSGLLTNFADFFERDGDRPFLSTLVLFHSFFYFFFFDVVVFTVLKHVSYFFFFAGGAFAGIFISLYDELWRRRSPRSRRHFRRP
uniref:Uncharacterized protein n=1 Tax=Opuntia streptacantha TaxID=393608 RepID=A0A7C8ZVP0_OPUST